MTGRYVYRDPARLTPGRLAELHAIDEEQGRRAGVVTVRKPNSRPGAVPRAEYVRQQWMASEAHAQKAARLAEFGRLRAAGVSVAEAAEQLGVAESTGRKYEYARRESRSRR